MLLDGQQRLISLSAINSMNGAKDLIADADRDDGKRFVVRADGTLTAFVELQSRFKSRGNGRMGSNLNV